MYKAGVAAALFGGRKENNRGLAGDGVSFNQGSIFIADLAKLKVPENKYFNKRHENSYQIFSYFIRIIVQCQLIAYIKLG